MPVSTASHWQQVTRAKPCEACGKPDWCARSIEDGALRCMRPELSQQPQGYRIQRERDPEGAVIYMPEHAGGNGHRPVEQASARKGKLHPTPERAATAAGWAIEQRRGEPWAHSATWSYRRDGIEYARVLRFDKPDRTDKDFRPIHRDGDGWRVGDPPGGWLPYRVDDLDAGGVVYVVEGEKCADAAASVGLLAVTSSHGAKSASRTDWSALAGREAVIWADRDEAGEEYAEAVASILANLDPPATARIIDPPAELPEGGDVADYVEARECIEPEEIRAAIEALAEQARRWSASGPLILDPSDPITIARELVARQHTRRGYVTLMHHADEFRAHNGTAWPAEDPATVRARTWEFLEQATRRMKRGDLEVLEPFKPTKTRVDNVLDALKGVTHQPSSIEPPAWLDGREHPPPGELVPCRNGLLHLPTLELHQPTPVLFNLHALDFDYQPQASEPKHWMAFLRSLWPDDEQAIMTLQEIFGYLLTTDTSQQKVFLLIGPKRSGKGTIARVLTRLLGQANVAGPTLSSLSQQFGLQPLIGKLLAVIADARLGGRADQAQIAERLLSVSGEDALSIPRKHKPDWTGRLSTRFLILTNEMPRLIDTSGALASRFIVLTLRQSFYGREDTALFDRLSPEMPGILRWAIAGWHRLRQRGRFVQPESSADAVAELEELGSPVAAFVRERCVVEPGRRIETKRLFGAWQEWCTAEGRKSPGTAHTFGRDLKAAVAGIRTTQPRIAGVQIRFYEGIDLADMDG